MIALGYRLCRSVAAVFLKVLMRFRHIEIFFAVMRYGTATAAAQHLGISQPSVTTALKSAEKELGFDLFHRQGRGLSPTPEARVLMEEVTRAHNSLEAIQTVANKLITKIINRSFFIILYSSRLLETQIIVSHVASHL